MNFNSCLSGLIWVAQLIVFHASATLVRSGAGEALSTLNRYCHSFFQQDTEMPMGELLSWHLLLFTVSKGMVGIHQATWDTDEKILTYDGTELHMVQVPKLLLSEF